MQFRHLFYACLMLSFSQRSKAEQARRYSHPAPEQQMRHVQETPRPPLPASSRGIPIMPLHSYTAWLYPDSLFIRPYIHHFRASSTQKTELQSSTSPRRS